MKKAVLYAALLGGITGLFCYIYYQKSVKIKEFDEDAFWEIEEEKDFLGR